ncbi:MAG TPA: NapC/NirT family cytochrome c, partial [Vicinamibacterales bacterium]|nr:NapC/NirT family cytochrome c [Vicinamibacterales bacterium]
MRVDLPSAMRNPVSLIGVAVTTAMAVVFLLLLTLEFTGQLTNPYAGLLVFVAVPFVFVLGLMLIPIGIWRQHRRVAAGYAADDWPVVDLRLPRTRSVIVGVALLTIVNLFIVSLAGFGAVHHMESTEFCGQTCHTTMEPEWKAHQASPHSKVACVKCHVGPGAAGFVEAKAAGTRQLWHVIINNVQAPVEAPVHSMPPARETCFGCHSGAGHQGDRLKVVRDYADDETATETATTLQMKVGGVKPASGIHWHIAQQIEYIATDRERQTIPYVKFTDGNGKVKEYAADGVTKEQLAQGERRSMDCMDCHNRPAHTFDPSPERAVDVAIANGNLPRTLPFARREAVAALKDEYASGDEAQRGIDARLRKAFASHASDPALARTVSAVQDIYARN